MRSKNSLVNIVFGIGGKFLTIFTQFFVRTIFIHYLGSEYLGVNGLFTNILSILSLAELGIGNAIIFSLYKPLAQKDNKKVKALMGLYEKSYRIIAIIVLTLGLLLVPFLKYIIKNPPNINENLILIYVLFLLNSVISYLFAYKRSLIIADQKEYIVTIITNIFNLLSSILQIIMLIVTKSFINYLIVQIVSTIITNIYISSKADKIYPMLKNKDRECLDKEEMYNIFKNVKALIIYKVGTLLTVGLDNIVISTFVGVITVGIYSNYTMIVNSINSILNQVFNALTASVGNLNAGDDVEKKEFMYHILLFTAFWLYGFCTICLYVLINPFIEIWAGSDYLLGTATTLAIVLNFYFLGMNNPTMIFRNTLGLYIQGKYRPIIGAIINIIISLLFVNRYGILGVVLGTLVSRILVLSWYEPRIIYKNTFNKSASVYLYRYIIYTITVLIVGLISNILLSNLTIRLGLMGLNAFITKLIGCIFITNIIFYVLYWRTREFKYLKMQATNLKNKLIKSKKIKEMTI